MSKTLYLIRHGEAEFNNSDDTLRTLSSRGRSDLAKKKSHLPAQLDLLLVSPLLRAQQTSEILFDEDSVAVEKESHALVPEATPLDILHLLETLDQDVVALVGHNPLMTRVLHALGGATAQGVSLDTSAVVKLSGELFSPHALTLDWIK